MKYWLYRERINRRADHGCEVYDLGPLRLGVSFEIPVLVGRIIVDIRRWRAR